MTVRPLALALGAGALLAGGALAAQEKSTTAAATRLSFAGAGRIDATVGYQPKAVDTQLTHKSMTRPGSPPRGRLR